MKHGLCARQAHLSDAPTPARASSSRQAPPGDSCCATGQRQLLIRGRPAEAQQADDMSVGQLVLSVDFAPPTQPDCPAGEQHLAELSVCVRQRGRPDEPPAGDQSDDEQAGRPADCVPSSQRDSLGAGGGGAGAKRAVGTHDWRARQKRRLVYERTDCFALALAGPLGGRPASWLLPFKDDSFDGCLCLNLLNVRLAGGAARAPSWAAEPESEERNWLRLEALTAELRVALLAELSRIVRPKGECPAAAIS